MLTTIRRCPTSSEPELNLTSVDEAPQTSSAINHWQSGDHLFHHGQLRVPEAAHLFYMERSEYVPVEWKERSQKPCALYLPEEQRKHGTHIPQETVALRQETHRGNVTKG